MKKFESKIFSRGSIAVECALMLPIFLLLFSAVLFLGKIFWHYTVLEKAAQDSAAFLARVSTEDIRSANAGIENPIAGFARKIALAELAELLPGDSVPSISILCDSIFCDGISTPTKITIVIRANMLDPLLSSILMEYGLGNDVVLTATASTEFIELPPAS